MSALGTSDLARFRGRLRVEKLLAKLCQPFLLNDATDICHLLQQENPRQSLKLSVSGGNFFGNMAEFTLPHSTQEARPRLCNLREIG